MMAPGPRKFALTAHVTSSVGWFGAVAAFLALAVAGLTSRDPETAHASYLAMELIGWYVIVPMSLASLATGLVQALGTSWGLFQHFWVLVKLLMTLLATVLLMVHMRPVGYMAGVPAATILSGAGVGRLRIQLVGDASAALLVLLVATVLSVYKPRGLTRYGRRRLREQRNRTAAVDVTTPAAP